MQNDWTPTFSLDAFNKSMDNAFRRISGSIGADLSRDLGNTKNLKATAADILHSNLEAPYQPTFLRLGQAALSATSYKPGGSVDIRECAGEILREFFEEGNAASLVAKAELRAGALEYLKSRGFDEAHCNSVLSFADNAFAMPEKDSFTQEAVPFFEKTTALSTKASLAGAAAFVPVVFLLRNPIIAGIVAACAAGAAYYFGRSAERTKVERMLHQLPRKLYDLLLSGLQRSARRYGEIINAAVSKGTGPQTKSESDPTLS